MMIDIDYFKSYNDHYGHLSGNTSIVKIANVIKNTPCINKSYIFRLSGEVFGILISGISYEELESYAQKIKCSIERLKIPNQCSKISDYLTVSIGAVNISINPKNCSINDIYNIADQNLLTAKNSGRNSVKVTSNTKKVSSFIDIDEVTQLPTRVKFTKDIDSLKSDAMLILLFINDYSIFHEYYDNKYIDELLLNKVKLLRKTLLDDTASIYRINVNEFAILVRDQKQFERYLSILKYTILQNSTDSDDNIKSNLVISFCAGVSYGKSQLLRKANLALSEAFKNVYGYSIYEEDEETNKKHKDRLDNLNIYQEALENDNIVPYFQPLVDSKSENIQKYEALARIIDEDNNIITPNLFLDAAKEDKTFEYFTRQLLQKVFHIYSKNDIEISINLTYENISSQELVKYIKNRLDKYGGERITFEIIESEELLDYNIVSDFIAFVKEYGCKIAMDDFGTGYSNFTNLIKLDIDYVKIDGSIIQKLNSDKNIENMTKSLISFAKDTNIKVIAEFVSSQEIVDKVKELNIDLFQGYYYGKPKLPNEYGLAI